eukprot:TRINITY_DN14804_c0_g2_i1.p1 TRINITY_DN14804_c0_g2~~TRINITY_DN14804_c0_g2_i1.p1  ORF type:complete len:424 (-),score=90.98 TRINITY_DN14804_c0_g2_i1:17-1288(-)
MLSVSEAIHRAVEVASVGSSPSRSGSPREHPSSPSGVASPTRRHNSPGTGEALSVGMDDQELADLDSSDLTQSEKLIRQMRACVLVHHQLSCLLIHRAALDAGLFRSTDVENGAAVEKTSSTSDANGHCRDEEPDAHTAALRHTIMSESTARLFSMALRDKTDLESMGDTLKEQVLDMLELTGNELRGAGCGKDGHRLIAELASSISDDCISPVDDVSRPQSAVDLACSTNGRAVDDEAEALCLECDKMERALAARGKEIAALQLELADAQHGSQDAYRSTATATFDDVQMASDRNKMLRRKLEELRQQPPTRATSIAPVRERATPRGAATDSPRRSAAPPPAQAAPEPSRADAGSEQLNIRQEIAAMRKELAQARQEASQQAPLPVQERRVASTSSFRESRSTEDAASTSRTRASNTVTTSL